VSRQEVLMSAGAARAAEPAAEMAQAAGELAGIPVPPFAISSLSPPEFEALHQAVRPRGGSEPWTQIPWQSDLWLARQQARGSRSRCCCG
jgi:hypothetical protein